ncbi:MAG: dTDP-4-dehydrorhamnose reductase [Oscillospiraceae bacterium]|nr:dTDP-4-dehydrorhamnose reductase [Oscillospiraceae bacterium]
MRILVTGALGQLGHDAVLESDRRGWETIGVDIGDFDLTDRAATLAALEAAAPDCVIHCAAYTAVDKAEAEPERAYAVNALGTSYVAEYCARRGIWLIYVSTDYVFDGSGDKPHEIDEPPNPLNAYGAAKLAGERFVQALCGKHMIVRTSWVFGNHGGNFVKAMLRLGAVGAACQPPALKIVHDQIGAPTYTVDLARLLCDMAARPVPGLYHAANAGACSWAAFAAKLFELSGLSCRVIAIPSSEYPQAAQRPKNSRLSQKALIGAGYAPLPPWESALAEMLNIEMRSSS